MDWRKRLRDLVVAGGALTLSGCPITGFCNANPDPCCAQPNGTQCMQKKACEAKGEGWDYVHQGCLPLDGGADLSSTDSSGQD